MLAWLLGHRSCDRKHKTSSDRLGEVEDTLRRLERHMDEVEDFVKRHTERTLKRIERDAKAETAVAQGGAQPSVEAIRLMQARKAGFIK